METREKALRELRESLKDVPRKPKQKIRGLGDVVHKVTSFLGMHHCSECEKRRERMNRWMRFNKAE